MMGMVLRLGCSSHKVCRMPSKVGPYDGRKARRSRCDACVRRKIKCHGGIPCENCTRTNRTCKAPRMATNSTPVFVGQSTHPSPSLRASVCRRVDATSIPNSHLMWSSSFDRSFSSFFMSFLPMNIFASGCLPIDTELLATAKTSSALRDAIHALSILHRKQQGHLASAGAETLEALQAYGRSVRCVQSQIASNQFPKNPSALWTTFLLGLFELMRDSTGQNWLSHFLHGTCTMLRLQGPKILTSSDAHATQKRTFFLATRVFEITRSLVYSSPSFLSEPQWTNALARFWQSRDATLWHPKEALFDILPRVSELSIRAIRFCITVAQFKADTQCAHIQSLADEGWHFRTLLQQWWVDTTTWEQARLEQSPTSTTQSKTDKDLLIAYIYYHAISIYLSGTYDYHTHWSSPSASPAPILPRSTISWHVTEILRISQELLAHGIAGLVLFFPLRVAGARAADVCLRNEILELLSVTRRGGFVVAEAFQTDLLELWARKGGEV